MPEIYPATFDWAFLLDGQDVMIEECLGHRGNSVFLVSTEDGEYMVKHSPDLDADNYNAWMEV